MKEEMPEPSTDLENILALRSEEKISDKGLINIINDLCRYYNQTPTSVQLMFNGKMPSVSFKNSKENADGLLNILDALNLEHLNKNDRYGVYSWAEFCMTKLMYGRRNPESSEVLKSLDEALKFKVYLVGFLVTPADVLVYLFIYDVVRNLSLREKELFGNVCRWFDNIQLDNRLRGRRDIIAFSRTRLYA